MATRLLPWLMLLLAPIMTMLNGAAGASPSWCVCRQEASNAELQSALDFACGNGADCSPLRPGGNCDGPRTLLAHCSYAVNSYFFQSNMGATCHFDGTAFPSSTDPSYGTCKYPASEVTKSTSIGLNPFVYYFICLAAGFPCFIALGLCYEHCRANFFGGADVDEETGTVASTEEGSPVTPTSDVGHEIWSPGPTNALATPAVFPAVMSIEDHP